MNKTDYIKRSFNRCREYEINKDRVYSKKILNSEDLYVRHEYRRELIIAAEPFMDQLYNFVKGSSFFSVLTDEEGCILTVIGDEEILSDAFSLKMIPGAFMNEENIGTNAMGTAIAENRPIQVSADEHFIEAYHRWTCSGAPIKDENGNIIGSLDLTGYSENVHSHTLGMVVAAANAIEKMLEINRYNEELKNNKIFVETIIDSIPFGIITCDPYGSIISANKETLKMFGYDEENMEGLEIKNIFSNWEKVKNSFEEGETTFNEDVIINAKTNKVYFNLTAYPIKDVKGEINNIVYIFKDVKRDRKSINKILESKAIYTFDKIIGENRFFIQAVEFAKKVADSKSTILIMGESGTGKEVFAQGIQNHGKRKNEPFVAINCGAIPKSLIESELFGYEEGAFTGAKRGGQLGKFELANKGTIFLDEIGEMPLDMQTRLLRVIEEGTVNRIGSGKSIPVDVRIIAATHKDLFEEVKKGDFRKDLFYRLNVLPIRLPPLRDRKEDIPLLIEYFMKKISKKLNKRPVEINKEYMEFLINYEWPGNIRELENLIELVINTENIPIDLNNKSISIESIKNFKEHNVPTLEEVEKRHIKNVLTKFKGCVALSAKALDIGRNTLYRKIRKYNINCSQMEQSAKMEQK
ncbi:sigma-54-dependent Fis family transcriptional regulator [Anaeromicrobium sediminis]|uniref:Sigma-54-dependent Fis family transcriptional regulator n=1 Tax=Anaeromicrobium sediminis TaxID=1478221 RepID=A0A267MJV3_9FIRM|nr:sigma 54-interacting transcriptional regulator [Anaeromicrobium sediminis]PAB59864.1 sigma-54-dependent Fis family transcriptional regulator [Anaeromicrobium sediminis]